MITSLRILIDQISRVFCVVSHRQFPERLMYGIRLCVSFDFYTFYFSENILSHGMIRFHSFLSYSYICCCCFCCSFHSTYSFPFSIHCLVAIRIFSLFLLILSDLVFGFIHSNTSNNFI